MDDLVLEFRNVFRNGAFLFLYIKSIKIIIKYVKSFAFSIDNGK